MTHSQGLSSQYLFRESHPFLLSFLLSTDHIWREGTPFEAMTGRTIFSGVLLSCKANARGSMHIPRYHLIIILSLTDIYDWRDSQGKWLFPRIPDRNW